jgi:transposase InsO family protein
MSTGKKREVIELVRRSPLPKRETLGELGIACSTYYRWQRRFRKEGEAGLVDRKPELESVWNRLRPEERDAIVSEALRQPDRSPRELACWLTDHAGFTVSESSVYRVMKRHGLIPEVRPDTFPAGKEYRFKTTHPNEQWQSDASYFFVVGWGFYYFISVLDDYSRMILAWELKRDMTSVSISEVVEQAIAWTGVQGVPVEDRTRLVTDNGPGYISHAFEQYLAMHQIRHIRCSPHHPQTNGNLERFHQSMKARLNLLVYTSAESLERAMIEFIGFYNHRRYHEGIGNVTPADVYYGRREGILKRREEQKQQTILQRLEYNLGRCLPSTQG